MIEQREPAITVTNVNPNARRRKREQVMSRQTYESVANPTPDALNLVNDLREKIEMKEAEVTRLREALQRDDEVDITQAAEQLKQLQSAFDTVQKMCAERMKPVELSLRKAIAAVDGRNVMYEVYNDEAVERHKFCDRLQDFMERTTADLIDPPVHVVSENCLEPLAEDSSMVQTHCDRGKRANSLEGFAEKQLAKLNEVIQKQLADASEREQKALRKRKNSRKDLDVRCQLKKPMVIDSAYLNASKQLEKHEMDLSHVSKFNTILKEDIRKMTDSNRKMVEEIGKLNEELIELTCYLPEETDEVVSRPGTVRNLLQKEETQRDQLQVKVFVSKKKLAIDHQRQQTMQSKLNELPIILDKKTEDLEHTRKQREIAEGELRRCSELRSELLSEQVFKMDERQAMLERIKEHRRKLKKIEKNTRQLELVLQRQTLIREFNDRKNNLRNCNLSHVAELVQSMIGLHNEIGSEEPKLSASSSATEGIRVDSD